MVRVVSLSVLLTLIVILGLTFYKVLAPFLLPLFLAAVFAILCEPIQAYFVKRTGGRLRLASGLTTASVVSILLVPLIVGTVLASLQLYVLATGLANRNLARTWREQTQPVLEHAAEFINTRVRPVASPDPAAADAGEIHQGPVERSSFQDDEPQWDQPAVRSGDRLPGIPDASAGPQPLAGPLRSAPASGPPAAGLPLEPADDAAADPQRPRETPSDLPLVNVPPPPPPVTAESLRGRLEVWMRGWLAEIGRKSLGMAGGTFDLLSGSLVAIGSAALSFAIFAIALYYFLADGTQLVRATERLIPVHVEYQRQMLGQFARVVRAVVMATFFAALAQAVATIVALWMFGFDHLLVLFVLCLLMAMIPMLGTWLVWLPCAVYLAWQGHWMQALVLAAYGAVFVGTLDNLVRTYVLNTDVKLHPLLALISVLGGLQVMGLWGMFVGPIVASCLHALVRIFNHELAALSEERFAGLSPSETDIPALAADAPADAGP
jgi:predicted PurR-regulated permease PerM